MIKRIVLFLIRKKLGLKLYQNFRFKGQKFQNDYYCFGRYTLMKFRYYKKKQLYKCEDSSIGLDWLLSEKCEIELCEKE